MVSPLIAWPPDDHETLFDLQAACPCDRLDAERRLISVSRQCDQQAQNCAVETKLFSMGGLMGETTFIRRKPHG